MGLNNKTARALKKDFPIFRNNPRLVYLDNAASTQKPAAVVKFVNDFYTKGYANVHRGLYSLSEKSTELYGKARQIVADFVNAAPEEIIFTSGTTDSINSLSSVIKGLVARGKNEILLTEMEHHANIVPWQEMAKKNKLKLKFVRVKDDFTLDMEDLKKKMGKKTAIVSFCHVSNTLGTVNPVKDIVKLAKKHKALTVVDAAQSVSRVKTDVRDLDCDFLVFSGHKVFGPTGVGVLYGKKKLLEKLIPFRFGGEMIKTVTQKKSTWADLPEKFEAGTPNIAGALGLGVALKMVQKIGVENIHAWEKELTTYAMKMFKVIEGMEIYSPEDSLGIVSFNVAGVHPHDVASMLDSYGIAIRTGHHCTMPLIETLGLKKKGGTCRVSFAFYNTFDDINKLVFALKKIKEKFE